VKRYMQWVHKRILKHISNYISETLRNMVITTKLQASLFDKRENQIKSILLQSLSSYPRREATAEI
jgi:hypothetical protein